MVTAVVAACAVLGACALTVLAVRLANERADRRLRETLNYVDRHLETMSAGVARAIDAAVESGGRLSPANLSLDFDDVIQSLLAEAAVRTRADAVVLRIDGPKGRPVIASIGAGAEGESLERSFAPPRDRLFRSAVVDWTYPEVEAEAEGFGSALVTPVASPGIRGTLAAYAWARHAFRPEHAAAVQTLVEDMAVALANARRFAEVEARINVDPTSGVPDRRGYELELGRETARARRTGKPLSVLVVGIADRRQTEAEESSQLGDLARLVGRVARSDDIACMRGVNELAILLPATAEPGAASLSKRLETETERVLGLGAASVTTALVEALPHETAEALEARIETTLNRPRAAAIAVLEDSRTTSTAAASTVHSSFAGRTEPPQPESSDLLRGDALEAVAGELLAARHYGRSLTLVVLGVDGLDDVSEREGREAADSKLSTVAGRLDRSLGAGSVHRLGAGEFALVLPGSGVDDAEALVDALQSSLEPPYDEAGLVLSAGVTEVADGDDAQTALGRAQHALWQATQAGPGTVVVAVPSRRPTPPR